MTQIAFPGRLTAFLLVVLLLASLAAPAEQAPSVAAPLAVEAAPVARFKLTTAPAALRIRLEALGENEIVAVREKNSARFEKRLQIGIPRSVATPDAASARLAWAPVEGGFAARWEVTSAGAPALRVGLRASALPPGAQLRFAGSASGGLVYGPFGAADILSQPEYWSPVLEGETGTVELFVPSGDAGEQALLAISSVSHLIASPGAPNVESLLKAAAFCEVDVACRAATDTAFARTSRAVARMTFTSGASTFLCTGTLLNTTAGPTAPYFYTANHCIDTQAVASTLTTHWFFEATSCGSGILNPGYVQLPGGAALLHGNAQTDVSFLQLNATPPAGTFYAGWSATTLGTGAPLTAIHHPAGDFKKVSLGTAGGFFGFAVPGDDHIVALWNSVATGVTEGGSSGSGIFTAVGSPAVDYLLRGGLHGGPSSCFTTGVNLRDYYSRFDRAFAFISPYLAPPGPPRLANISTRMQVLTGNDVMIAGFIIGGSTSKTVAIVAQGPSLIPAGIPNALPNPTLTLVRSLDGAVIASSDDWQAGPSAAQLQAAGFSPPNALESGILVNLAPGAYTAIVSGVGGNTGVGLVGVFEVDHPEVPLINISTRGEVLTGNDVMIGGFIIQGTGPQTVVVQAIGPSLAAAGIANPLANPSLTLVRSSDQSVIATNDDWGAAPNAAQIQAAGLAPGNSLESAIMVTLQPGAYTAIVAGVGGGTGVGIVAVYTTP